ncbi:hypothetical protein FSP39_024881 [Pinctada imbricata]|uniref:MIR domain-containing protein n=1 Tax=Pinctada imbricata TaxID=66713 RepID=A0AA88XJK1_PINIB|nr:hypothetical protein FSP39_024881 [Pinctada imbricata]
MMQSNTAVGEYLCVGDYIGLFSVETEGYVYSLQSSTVHSGLSIYQNQDREKPSKIPNAEAVVFQVCIQNRYKLNKKLRKWTSMQAVSAPDGKGKELDKTQMTQAKLAADAENADNAAEQKRQMGKRVRYGEIVQLKHSFTNKYIHMCTSQTSHQDKNNMLVMLQEFNAKNAQFRILPQYKVKSEGEVVQIYDQIVFESIKSPGHFFHASQPFQIDHFTFGSEVNLGVERSGFTLVRYHHGIQEHDPYVRGGSVIRLFHKELEAYMVAEGLFDDEVTEDGDILRWEQQVRLRHMTTRKYLCIDASKEISLTDDNEDPRTVFRLYSVLSERDEIHFESYCRIEHVLTGFWLHALKDEDYVRKKFRSMENSNDQSLRGLRWDSAQVRQVAASGESQYDDAFTIQSVEKIHVDEFNYVAGMVPFLLNLIKDREERHFLNSKKTHTVLTAMEELRKFMVVKDLPSKNRQKLMRNLRVIDLLVKILQCTLDGTNDEMNLIQVFKEAYEILYTYMIGKSRKNALYFAKYIEFFQTQFTQKGGIGLNVAQMIVELIRDKRKIVDRITHEQIDEFIGLLQKSQGQGTFLTARGQDINRQPNILYITTDHGRSWTALHSFVDPDSEVYDKDKHDFLIHQLDLYKALCYGRNDYSINMITKELRYLTWEETFLALRSDILPDAIRAKYCDLTTSLFVDVGNNYSVLDHPNICFVYDYVGSKDEEKSQGDFVVKELVAIFPVLRDWIAEFLLDNKCMIACDIGHNMLIEQVVRLLYHLVKFGYYLDAEDVQQLLAPLLTLLDGRHDNPFKKDKEKRFRSPKCYCSCSRKSLKIQKKIIRELRDMFNVSAIFDIELMSKILMDLSSYKYNKMITKSLNILNKVYSSKTNMFNLSSKAQILLTQDSARVHREVLKSMPILRRLARAKLDDQQVKVMADILDDLGEFCHLPMTPDEPHPMNQNILISNGILNILFDILTQEVDTKLLKQYGGMKDVFKKTFHLVKLLARENERVQLHLFERIDILLDVRVVESDLAIALKEVFMGNANTCLKISPRQIQKIVSRASDLQERAPEFLDLLGMGDNMFIESLCQTILPMEDLLWVLNNPRVDNVYKKPFLKCLHHVYLKSGGNSVVETGAGEMPHNEDLWDYLSNLSIDMNRLTDSVKEDPDKIAIHLKTAPEKSGSASAPDFESSAYGSVLYFLEAVLPFLDAFYRNFYYPDQTAYSNEIDETDHMAKAVVLFCETVGPLLYKPQHMKSLVNTVTIIVPISNMPNSNIEHVLDRFSTGIQVEDTSCAVRRGNIEYYADEIEINAKFRIFAKNTAHVFAGHNTVTAQLKVKSNREYTDLGGNEEIPLGEEFQSLVRKFINTNEKKVEKRYDAASVLIEQLHISMADKRMSEKARLELDELNIKCLQILRAIIHNEERKMPETWAVRTTEPKIMKSIKLITQIQNYMDKEGAMKKSLPHLSTRNEDVAKEVLGFLCLMLFNANTSVQQSMLDYFLSTREEVFFMAVRDRMALSTNSIKEKRSLQAQLDAKKKETSKSFDSHLKKSFPISIQALKSRKKDNSKNDKKSSKKPKKPKPPKEKKVKKQHKVKDSATNGLKKELSFANPLMKEDQSLIVPVEHETEMVTIKVEDPEPEPVQQEPENPEEDESLEYRNDGYIELVLKVMARMCDGQNHHLQDYLREQPDNVKSFNIIGEVTRFLNVVYANITGKNIDLVIQCFETMNEFTAILNLRESIANLILSLVEENGPGATEIAVEVKDTLDKKAVIGLMTECYEMHQVDKKKIEELKHIADPLDVPDPKSKVKSLKDAGGTLFKGVVRKQKDEFADTYMDVGFRLYLVMARMCDVDTKLFDRFKLLPIELKAYNFYKKNCMSIEIVKDDELQKVNFRVKNKRVLREEVKESLKWNVDRSSPSNKIRELMGWTKDIMKDIAYQRHILSNPIALLLTKGWLVWNHFVTILSFAINILMLVTWQAQASLVDKELFGNSTTIPAQIQDPTPKISILSDDQYNMALYIMGGLHNFFTLLVVVSYFLGNHPRMPNIRSIIASIKQACARKKKDDEVDDEKKKPHQSKLDAKFFSFQTFYYMAFLGLSVGGTFYHGYFFAFHLLNIVNNNQLLGGVIKAVTQNGKSLVWVAVLGLVVFYLYGIIAFALMRSMFDPDEYLYCDSLWQCTVTTVRYGLIGDLFEVMRAHPSEATFAKFGIVVLFHVSFFIFITTIGLNIIFGIIVDTFSELRDLKWTAEADMRDTCFICSRNSYDFEHHGKGFDHHVRQEHNMWSYIFFFIHLDGTKVNDYTALEMYTFKLLQKENYDFFPLDRALSLAGMGKDSTETKIDDLLYHVTSIVEKQRKEELEKKRNEERMRQKVWEQKHRLGSFRRRAKLPTPSDQDPLAPLPALSASPADDQQHPGSQPSVPTPPTQYLRPVYPTTGQLSGRTTPSRRYSDVGLATSMLGQSRLDLLPPPPSSFRARRDRRSSFSSRSGSPVRVEQLRRRSPSRYYDDPDDFGQITPDRYDDRPRSPSRSRLGSDAEMRAITPSPLSRRDTLSGLSPRWPDSHAASPRGTVVFFSDADPFLPPPSFSRRGSVDRRGSDYIPESIEGPPYIPEFDLPERDHDTDSIRSGEYRGESRY